MKNLTSQVIHGLFDFSSTASHGGIGIGIRIRILIFLLFSVTTLPFSMAQSVPDPTQNTYEFRGGIKPSMTALIVVLVFAFFFIAFFAVYLLQCRANPSDDTPVNPRISAQGGLDAELIETFPIIAYSEVKDLKIGKMPLECAVCLNEFQDDESLRLLPKCDHVFHPDCIDHWLASNITCPVCRTNLATETDEEIAAISEPVRPASNESPNPRSELNQVSINIVPQDQTAEIAQASKQNRPPRSRSSRAGRFPRSHSTGHSLVQPGESLERFTLRLPEEVRKQIAMNSKLDRTRSNGGVLPRMGSSRSGYRSGGEGTSYPYLSRGSGRFDRRAKSDRWVFTMAPPFLSRVGSVKSPVMRI